MNDESQFSFCSPSSLIQVISHQLNRKMRLLLLLSSALVAVSGSLPHIFMVVVDDWGWADVGYHGAKMASGDSLTPTIDGFVKEGIELNRHYVHMFCTPTRASFQSGRLPIHVVTTLCNPCDENGAIPRNMTGIAAQMKKAGYATHQVGKWDAGMTTPHHTPKGRGYDSSLNYYGHANWMWTESEWLGSENHKGEFPAESIKDFWDTDKPAYHLNGTGYEEYIFRDRMLDILHNHNQSVPLFLQYDSKVAHYPLQAPAEYQNKFTNINQINRRLYYGMVNFLDDQLKNITDTMKELNMWDNTLMVVASDNGGYTQSENGPCNTTTGTGGSDSSDIGHAAACFNGQAGASNWPLRGGKHNVFEGGIRVNAFVSGGYVPEAKRGTKEEGMIHITDWYTTFCSIAGVPAVDPWAASSGLPGIDGLDMWPLLSGRNDTSPRTTILVNKELLIHNNWKYIPPKTVLTGDARGGPQYPNATTATDPIENHKMTCPSEGCLFNLDTDLYETTNVAAQNPDVVKMMQQLMETEKATIWEVPHSDDPKCKATAYSKYGGFYGPWKEI
eukprot:TRINITY_DN10315_c0_g2_i3.p1 TRINITY_DN10315_c0_g2~~TRINITY_DN10315_c0_g2_i3.p1  ORF type:complete len:558 (+),score=132.44 TRINITY_DN10315_c0_g2_i3:266-1939(+)